MSNIDLDKPLDTMSKTGIAPAGDDTTYQPEVFSLSGRIGRLRYLAYSSGVMLLIFTMMFLVSVIAGPKSFGESILAMSLLGVLYLGLLISHYIFGRRRLNDLDQSGWWQLLALVPFANLGLAIYMLFFPGTEGDNRFGKAPCANSAGVTVLACTMPALFVIGIVAAIAIPAYVQFQEKAHEKAILMQQPSTAPSAAERTL